MPVHDWSRVDADLFHDFHQCWTIGIRNALNGGLLPKGYSALVERHAGGVVEFPSSRSADRRRDYEEKKNEYRDIGVREYWIVDRFRRMLTVYHRRGARWAKRVIGEGETYRTPILPGFDLSLAKLLAVSDQYQQ